MTELLWDLHGLVNELLHFLRFDKVHAYEPPLTVYQFQQGSIEGVFLWRSERAHSVSSSSPLISIILDHLDFIVINCKALVYFSDQTSIRKGSSGGGSYCPQAPTITNALHCNIMYL